MPRIKKRVTEEDGDSYEGSVKKSKQAAEAQEPRETIKLKDSPFVGTLLFSGGSNWDLTGRKQLTKAAAASKNSGGRNLFGPHTLSALSGIRVRSVFSGPVACHSLIITEDGKAMTWGRNEREQLGHGDTKRRDIPTVVEGLERHHIVNASCGRNHTLCLADDGTAFSFGDNRMGQCGIGIQSNSVSTPCKLNYKGPPVVKVACGADFSIILDCKGALHSFGSQEYSQLGHNTNGQYSVKPTKLSGECVSSPKKIQVFVEKGRDGTKYLQAVIKDIACGVNHSVAMDMQKRVFTWGFGGYGRLGHHKPVDEPVPRCVTFFDVPLKGAEKIGAGATYCLVVTETVKHSEKEHPGQLYFWGQTNTAGEATMYPKPVTDLGGWNIRSLGCSNRSIVLAADKSVVSWGPSPTYGELAHGENGAKSSARAKEAQPLVGMHIHQVACGMGHSLFIARDESEEEKAKIGKFPVYTP